MVARNQAQRSTRSKLLGWQWLAWAGIFAGIGILALPDAVEGPLLLPISPGHGLSVLDGLALIPLVAGSVYLYSGLWRSRALLLATLEQRPAATSLLILLLGTGMGLLLASVFSTFFWWWVLEPFSSVLRC